MLGEILKETLRGKSIHKIMTNLGIRDYCLEGDVVDFGGGKKMRWSYFRYLRKKDFNIVSVDVEKSNNPDIVADLETEKLAIPDESKDMVLAFNVLEHIYNTENALGEARRVLKTGGRLLGSVPFLLRVHPDPNDYFRFTGQAISNLLKSAGFRDVAVKPIGLGPCIAAHLQIEAYLPRLVRALFLPPAVLADRVLLKFRPKLREFYPLSYVFVAVK